MGNNEDERSAAYNRHIYFEFANIVQHYNKTARPEHDDIDFEPATVDELDGLELDMNGQKLEPLDEFNDFIVDLISAIQEYGSFEDIPDDFEFDAPDDLIIDIVYRDLQEKCDNKDCQLCNSETQDKNHIIIHIFKKQDKPESF